MVVRYACTESVTVTGTLADDPPEVLLHTVGRPGPGVELRLVDDGLADDGLLDTYGEERLPHAAGVVAHAQDKIRVVAIRPDMAGLDPAELIFAECEKSRHAVQVTQLFRGDRAVRSGDAEQPVEHPFQ